MLSTRRPASRTTAKASTRLYTVEIVFGLLCFRARGARRRGSSDAATDAAHPLLNALAEFVCLGPQFGVGELLDLRFKGIDGLHVRHQRLDDALVLRAENLT
jgi:hypothetical protein